jgi:hypothetical protein
VGRIFGNETTYYIGVFFEMLCKSIRAESLVKANINVIKTSHCGESVYFIKEQTLLLFFPLSPFDTSQATF